MQKAVEAEVDFLLESPHFGERFAIYWLDLVRFADTVGYHGDQGHRISPYRDYVINAFNRNLPFDQFTREQLAGDLLPSPSQNQIVATGYNRLLQTTHEGGLQPAEYRAIYQADRVRNVSAVWMGATVGCAQCHNHKYDPITSKEHRQLAAFFADIDDEQHFKVGSNTITTKRPPEILSYSDADRAEIKKLNVQLSQITGGQEKQITAHFKEIDSLKQQVRRERVADKKKALQKRLTTLEKNTSSLLPGEKLKQWKKVNEELQSKGRWTMITKALAKPRTVRVLPRGNWLDDSGEIVEPAAHTSFPKSRNKEEPTDSTSPTGSPIPRTATAASPHA